jgi:hypothetical protein
MANFNILANTQYSRIQHNRTDISGTTPTIFINTGSTSGYTESDALVLNQLSATDILNTELFFNTNDKRVFARLDNTIVEFVTSGGTLSDRFTTGATLNGNILSFNRNDTLSAYTVNLSGISSISYWTAGTGTNAIVQRNSNSTASGTLAVAEGYLTTASGNYSHAEGFQTTASGNTSHAEGQSTVTLGDSSHAEGAGTTAIGAYSHAEGVASIATGNVSHAEGSSFAVGDYSHAEGISNNALGIGAHAEGNSSIASGNTSHAEGASYANGDTSHSEGSGTVANGNSSHAEGYFSTANGNYSHAQGYQNIASGNGSHAEGFQNTAVGSGSHAEGFKNTSNSTYTHTGGQYNIASGTNSFIHSSGSTVIGNDSTILGGSGNVLLAFVTGSTILGGSFITGTTSDTVYGVNFNARNGITGVTISATTYLNLPASSSPFTAGTGTNSAVLGGSGSVASGLLSYAEGSGNTASGILSHAEGSGSTASNIAAHAEGQNTTSNGINGSHAEGWLTLAGGDYGCHAEGHRTTATGNRCHAEGGVTTATGDANHAEGFNSKSTGGYGHAEGYSTTATGAEGPHSEGRDTLASGSYSHAGGLQSIASGYASRAIGFASQATASYAYSMGNQTYATAEGASAQGKYTRANGIYSHVGGIGYNNNTNRVCALGLAAFNHSMVDVNHPIYDEGATGDGSVILGGLNHYIKTGATYSSIIGGSTNKILDNVTGSTILGGSRITGTTSDTVYGVNFNASGSIFSGGTNLSTIISTSLNGYVTTGGTQTLINKTLTSPILETPKIFDDTTGFNIILDVVNLSADLTADRTLLIDVNDVNRQIVLRGNLILNGNFTTAGAFATTLTSTNTTNVTLPTGGTLSTLAGTETLTNKRVTPRVGSTTSSATPTINTDNVDYYELTAQAVNITSFTTNLSGTPTNGQKLWIAITGTAARTIAWGASFESSTITLPVTTVTTARLDVGFIWNSATSKWRCIGTC